MKTNSILKNESIKNNLGKEAFLRYIAKLGVDKKDIDVISDYLEHSNKRITMITSTAFSRTNELVIKFLNSGSQKVIALKGIPGVYAEFYIDGHPKAVGVSENKLRAINLDIPNCGYIDSRSLDTESTNKLKSKIRLLKSYLSDETLNGIMRLEQYKFHSIKDKKQQIEDFSIYANAHIFDLIIIDKDGEQKIVPTCGHSPVIPRGVQILGVGPETVEKWGKVLEVSDMVITVGDMSLYKDILAKFKGSKMIEIHI